VVPILEFLPASPIIDCQAEESLGRTFFLLLLLLPVAAILGREEGGGEEFGGSNRSERPEAEPGENGESQSRSMSMGEEAAEASILNLVGRLRDVAVGSEPYTEVRLNGVLTGEVKTGDV